MGDLNVKMGGDNKGYELVMGNHGLGEMNENGELFADLCANNDLVIGGSIFPHKKIHKATWCSPDNITENQIDHFCIARKFRRSLHDVRAMRGVDVGSDHHLLVATLKLKLKRCQSQQQARTKYNVAHLRDPSVAEAFQINLRNWFQALEDIEDEDGTIDMLWQHLKRSWISTCEDTLGRQQSQNNEWISMETLKKVRTRKGKKERVNKSRTRAEKTQAQKEYLAAHKEARSARKDKRRYIENIAKEAEDDAAKGNMKDLYYTTRKLAGKFRHVNHTIKNKQGNLLTTTEGQLHRWVEHFEEVLNRPPPVGETDIPEAEHLLPVNCVIPSRKEISSAIRKMKDGKAAGTDNIAAEAFKTDINTSTEALHELFKIIWEEEESLSGKRDL